MPIDPAPTLVDRDRFSARLPAVPNPSNIVRESWTATHPRRVATAIRTLVPVTSCWPSRHASTDPTGFGATADRRTHQFMKRRFTSTQQIGPIFCVFVFDIIGRSGHNGRYGLLSRLRQSNDSVRLARRVKSQFDLWRPERFEIGNDSTNWNTD